MGILAKTKQTVLAVKGEIVYQAQKLQQTYQSYQ